jgi:3-deoxy-manno-octulosonate cytidylyltransferase (CMP-KDO synthetase)
MKAVIVIPARYGSSRFPGKPLHPVRGISTLERVWRIAKSVRHPTTVLIATEDQRIVDFATGFGGEAVMTSDACTNGTERVFDAIERRGLDGDIIVNLQGDALLTPPWILDAMIEEMQVDNEADIVTPAVRLGDEGLHEFRQHKAASPASGTTVVFDRTQRALYFSKMLIPYVRNAGHAAVYRHIGLYGFRRDSLERYIALPPSPLEMCEGLEQLRALEHGMKIRVAIVDYRGRSHGSIDSLADVKLVEDIIAREGELLSDAH